MASVSTSAKGLRRVQFVGADGHRSSIQLGRVTAKAAEAIKTRVEEIHNAQLASISLSPDTAKWLGEIDDKLHRKLVAVGLAKPRNSASIPLGGFLAAYIAKRTDVKPNTKAHLERARRNLVEFFGEDRPMADFTAGHADEFRIHLRETMADNTVRRICGRGKQFFGAAVSKRLIPENPFRHMATSVRANKDREYFVTRDEADKVLESCPDAEWRLLFALSRYGGLRCPSEHLSLRWGDIDWERSRIRVSSPKTEHHEGKAFRWVPLFPELRPYLEAVYDAAPEGTEHVITRYRDRNSNLRTQLERIIRKAGLEPWPKLFQNLRSTRETELAERFPIHVVCTWIGNSEAVAAKHYLQVTDEHYATASGDVQNVAQQPAATRRSLSQSEQAGQSDNETAQEFAPACDSLPDAKAPPVGLEPTTSRLTAGCSTN